MNSTDYGYPDFVTEVIASSDSNEGYVLRATYLKYRNGRVSGLRFDLQTYDEISFGPKRAKKFLKTVRRAEKRHAKKFGLQE